MRRSARVLLAVGLLVLSGLTALSLSLDPLAEFRQPDGSVSIPGEKFTPEIRRLLSIPESGYAEYTYASVRSAYPTLQIEGKERPSDRQYYNPAPRLTATPISLDFGYLVDPLMRFLSFEWLIGRATAADRFLVLGAAGCTTTTIATDTDCWSTTSGGAGGASVPGSADRALMDSASGAGSGTMDAAMSVLEWCSADSCNGAATAFGGTILTNGFALTIGTSGLTMDGVMNFSSSTITVSGNWDSSLGEQFAGSSLVVFAGTTQSLRVDTINGSHVHFYNLTVNLGATVTYQQHTSGWSVFNQATINGTMRNYDNTNDPWNRWDVNGYDTANPFVRGASGDVSQGGVMRFLALDSSTIDTRFIPAATYPYLNILGEGSAQIFRLTGAIETKECAPDYNRCALLINGWLSGNRVTFYTDNFAMTIRGTLWVGDLDQWHATAYFGSSTVNVFGGFDVIAQSIANLESATITSHNNYTPEIQSLAFEWGGTINGGTSTFNALGNFRMNAHATLTQTLNAQGMSLTINGTVVINDPKHIIQFGTSTWSVGGTWANSSTSSSWDAGTGTGTATFTSSAGGTMTFGNLGEAEFNNVVFDSSGSGATSFSMSTNSLRASNRITIRDTAGGGSTTVVAGSLDLVFKELIGASGGALTMNGFSVADFEMLTSGGTIALTAWTAYTESPVDIQWTFDPNTVGATITITFTLVSDQLYVLQRDGIGLGQSQADSSGRVTFSVAGGWSPHSMSIIAGSPQLGGGGGDGEELECDPAVETCPTEAPPTQTPEWQAALVVVSVIGGALALLSRGFLRRTGLVLLVAGIVGLAYISGWL